MDKHNPLRNEIRHKLNLKRIWDDAYYAGRRQVSDATYDKNKDEIRALLEASPDLKAEFWAEFTATSFSRLENLFDEIPHDFPMMSLDKSNKIEILHGKLQKWHAAGSKFAVCMWKIDGSSSGCRYNEGVLTTLVTRHEDGNGKDLTVTAYQIESLPKEVDCFDKIEVRGEMVIYESDFELANKEREAAGKEPYKNARNAVAGITQTKDAESIRALHVSSIVYDVLSQEREFKDHSTKLAWLKKRGFAVVEHKLIPTDIDIESLTTILGEWEAQRFNLGYEVDGLVFMVDETHVREELGVKSNVPEYAYAFKFKDIEIEFEIDKSVYPDGIEYCFGTTGVITPRAHFKENPRSMEILGVSVRHSNLHNMAELRRIGWKTNVTHAIVKRAGMVIPKVIEAIGPDGCVSYPSPPTVCPHCAGQLGFKGEIYQCLNDECDGKSFNRILRFIESMGIDDLGETTLLKIVEDGLVKWPGDLYGLCVNDLVNLERLGESSAKKIVKNIQASRNQPTWKVLAGLMIRGLGNTTSKSIAEKWPTLDDFLKNVNYDDLCKMDKIGDTVANNILQGVGREEMQRIIIDLIGNGIGMTVTEKPVQIEGPLTGKTFCMTGSPELDGQKVKKAILQAQIEAAGGTIMDMKKGLNYLIAGPDSIAEGSNKLEKAKKIGAEVISGDDVMKMIKG